MSNRLEQATPPLRIRLATENDAEGALRVYAPYILTPITFEEEEPTLEEFRNRIVSIAASYPYLVATIDEPTPNEMNKTHERIVGFAYAHPQAERAAYGWNAELSVYLAPETQGYGLGSALYRALISLVKLQGVKAAYAQVSTNNQASEHLHASFGFKTIGIQQHAGYTCGAWHDVAWLVKQLAPFDPRPTPIVAFPTLAALQPQAVREILAQANREITATRS